MQPSVEAPAIATRQAHHEDHRRRSRHESDPFLELSDEAVNLSDPPSSVSADDHARHEPSSYLVQVRVSRPQLMLAADREQQLVLTPLNMITFLASLFLVDHEQREWRRSQHSPESGSLWTRLISWADDPYQHINALDGTSETVNGAKPRSYIRKKHRAMAKLEMQDAFERHHKVLTAMIGCSLLVFLTATYALSRIYRWCVG